MACGRAFSFVMVVCARFASCSYELLFRTVAARRLICDSMAHSHTWLTWNEVDQNEDQMHQMT